MNEFLIPISTVFAAVIAFLANYFTLNKKISKLEERVDSEQKSNAQLVEELKFLREMKSAVDVQDNKIQKIDEEVSELKKLNEKITQLDRQLVQVETKMEMKFDLILEKLNKMK